MAHYRIKEWEKYQHYKDRCPPWIKLHKSLLTSKTWVMLDDASRVLAVACMMLAADTDNKIPIDPAYMRRVAYLNSDPDFGPLLETEFLELVKEKNGRKQDASKALAICTTEERRGERDIDSDPPGFNIFWDNWPPCERKQARGKCLEVWKRKGLEAKADAICTHLSAMRASEQWRDAQFIPAPLVYLNQERWDGAELVEPKPKGLIV